MPETKLTAEEVAAMTEARRASQELIKRMNQPGEPFVRVDQLILNKENDRRTLMTVPRPFFLTLKDHRKVKFSPGIASVPNELVDHWYVKAHDCKAYQSGAIVPAAHLSGAAQNYLGSDELPAVVRISQNTKRPIMDFIVLAAAEGKLSIADWNALHDDDRRDRIVSQIEAAVRAEHEAADHARSKMTAQPIEAVKEGVAEAKGMIDAAAAPNAPPSPTDGADQTEKQEGSEQTGTDGEKAS